MWRTYFPRAQICGFDIDDKTVQGDMSSRADLDRLVQTFGGPIDILIDDASHASRHQQIALEQLLPQLRPGGMCIIEDLHCQDQYFKHQNIPKTHDVLRRFQMEGTVKTPLLSQEQHTFLQNNIATARLFDSFTRVIEDHTDALGVFSGGNAIDVKQSGNQFCMWPFETIGHVSAPSESVGTSRKN
jgi:hypothetical protein